MRRSTSVFTARSLVLASLLVGGLARADGPIVTDGLCPDVQVGMYYRNLGDQALTVSTSVVRPSPPPGTVWATLNVQTSNIRVRGDGQAVTNRTGALWLQDTHPMLCGPNLGQLQLIRDAGVNRDATAYFSFYGP